MVIPKYYQYTKDSLKNDNEKRFNCWFDLYSHELNSNIHFSYFTFSGRQEYDALVQDAFEMANKHNVKASFRNEFSIQYPLNNVYGLMFDIEGPVASPMQFYLTDSTSHFLRGSLYFNDIVNRDSIAPIYNFIKEDFGPLFKSFKWTD
jgi:gliding motility-associated lipoprotein GldD